MMKTLEKINEENKLEEEGKKKKEIEDQSAETAPTDLANPETEDSSESNPAEKLFSPEVLQKISAIQMDFVVNPNVFLHTPSSVDQLTIESDEQIAKDLASFLWDRVLPNVTELVRLGEEAPYDGKSLTEFLHNNGVNMRYLGELSRRARAEEEIDRKTQLENQKRKNPMPVFWQDLLEVEIIARCMKHLINSFIGDNALKTPSPIIISALLNLLMGNGNIVPEIDLEDLVSDHKPNEKKKKNQKKNSGKSHSKPSSSRVASALPAPELFNLTKAEFWKKYSELAKAKFLHMNSALVVENASVGEGNPVSFSSRLSKLSILRRICQICGIRIQCRDYDWSIPTPFNEVDIQDIVPLVKTCEPDAPVPEAKYLLEEAKVLLQQGNIGAAFERAQDASKYVSQVRDSRIIFWQC
jgi:protein TIF31